MSVRSAVGFDGGIPVGIQNLESVLATEPAGDGGNLDITNLNSLTATTINGASAVGQDLGTTLTNGNTASKDIDMNEYSLTNVTSINGFTTNRNTQGEFIANTTIPATANIDFTIPIATPISLDIGTYLANIKINLSGTASVPTSYNIDLYLNDNTTNDLLTSSIIDSASAINGVSLTIPAFPVAVAVDNSILTLKGRVNANSSVLVSGFGNSYINCGLIFAGAIPPPNPPVPTLKWSFTGQPDAPFGNWKNLSSDTTGQYIVGAIYPNSSAPYQGIYRSTDYGSNWSLVLAQFSSFGMLCAESNGNGTKIFTGAEGLNQIETSVDSGVNWTIQGSGEVQSISGITSSSGGSELALIGPQHVYTTINGGLTFNQTLSGTNFRSIASSSSGQYVVVVQNGGTPYTSNDYGATWTQRSPSSTWVSVASDSTGQYLIGAVKGSVSGILLSSNYGANWTAAGSGIANLSAVSSSSTGQYLVACQDSGYIYTSNDSGVTWVKQDSAGSRNWAIINTNAAGDRITAVGGGYILTGVLA